MPCLLDPRREKLRDPANKKENCMNDEVLNMMEQRIHAKNNDSQKYRQINNGIGKRIRVTKQAHLEEKCKEFEELQNKYYFFSLHKS